MAAGAYAFRSLLRRGTRIVFGSDVPVASIDPREGVFAALERRGFDDAPADGWRPDEKLGFTEVVRAYTSAPPTRPASRDGGECWRPDTTRTSSPGRWTRRWSAATALPSARPRAALTVVGGRVVMRQ